jgi:hypothetical protein
VLADIYLPLQIFWGPGEGLIADADIVAATDDAIADGADVISMSGGPFTPFGIAGPVDVAFMHAGATCIRSGSIVQRHDSEIESAQAQHRFCTIHMCSRSSYVLTPPLLSRLDQRQFIDGGWNDLVHHVVAVLKCHCMQLLLASLCRQVAVIMAQLLEPSPTWLLGQPPLLSACIQGELVISRATAWHACDTHGCRCCHPIGY